jgi:hypothetical protein
MTRALSEHSSIELELATYHSRGYSISHSARRVTAKLRNPPPAIWRRPVFDQDGTLWVEHPMYTKVNVLSGSCPGGGGKQAGTQERRAVQDRVVARPGGDSQALFYGI